MTPIITAFEDSPDEGQGQQHGRDEVPDLAAADEVDLPATGVEVVTELCETHQRATSVVVPDVGVGSGVYRQHGCGHLRER